MPRVISDDDLDTLELERRPKNVDESVWLRARVDTILGWVDGTDVELRGVSRSRLLSVAAEHLSTVGDHERAVALGRRAWDTDDDDALDSAGSYVEVLLARGDVVEAEAVAQQLRAALRADPFAVDTGTIERVGEEFAYHGHLAIAERWFTLGVRSAELTDAPGVALARAMTFRAAVRRRAGKAPDIMDLDARILAAERGWTDDDPLLYKDDER